MQIRILPTRLLLIVFVIALVACGRRPTDAQIVEIPTAPPASSPAAEISGTFAPTVPAATDVAATLAPPPFATPDAAGATPMPAVGQIAESTPTLTAEQIAGATLTPDPNVDSEPPTWENRSGSGFGATEITPTSMTLAWPNAVDAQSAVTYEIYAGLSNPDPKQSTPEYLQLNLVGSSSVESYTVTGLTPNTVYVFLVIAVDAAGNKSGPYSKLILMTSDAQIPTAPTNLRYVPDRTTSESLFLTWVLSDDDSWVERYELFVNGVFYQNLAFYRDDTSAEADVYGLPILKPLELYIVAVDRSQNRSAPSEVIQVVIPDTIMPETVRNLRVIARNSQQITVAWDAAIDNVGVTAYVIYHDGEQQAVATTGETSYTFTGIAPDDFYVIRVFARDQAGNESISGETLDLNRSPVQ